MTTAVVAGVEVDTRHWIGGERVASADTFADVSPLDGTVIAEVSRGGAAEVEAAVAAASAAFPAWAAMPVAERSAILLRVAEGVESRLEDLAQLETRDNGSLLRSHRRGVMPRVAMNIRFFAEYALEQLSHPDFDTRGHRNPQLPVDQFTALIRADPDVFQGATAAGDQPPTQPPRGYLQRRRLAGPQPRPVCHTAAHHQLLFTTTDQLADILEIEPELKVRVYPREAGAAITDRIISTMKENGFSLTSVFVETGRLDEVFRTVTMDSPTNVRPTA